MPRGMKVSKENLREMGGTIIIFLILMLSGVICFLQEEGTTHGDNFYTGLNPDEVGSDDEEEMLVEIRSLSQNTRAGEDDYMNPLWEGGHGTSIGEENSLASADVDNDGIVEIIFGNGEGYIHIIQYSDGDYVDEWKSHSFGSGTFGLTSGDVDDDGITEIIVGTGLGELFILGYQPGEMNYIIEWSYEFFTWDIFGLATGDVDNDGLSEIVAGTSTLGPTGVFPNVYVFGYDGSNYVQEWMYWAEDSYVNNARSVAIGDVDDDGTKEFVVGISEYKYATETPRGSFYIFGYNNGFYTLEWKKDDTSVDIISIDIGNVDDDEIEEIVVGAALVEIYQFQSGIYTVENIILVGSAIVKVGDVNVDGQMEIVTGSGSVVSVWGEGTLLWESDNLPEWINGITIKDSDGDIINEIIVAMGSYESAEIMVFGFDGSTFSVEWKSEYISPVNFVCVDDVDRDNDNEVLFGTTRGDIFVYGFQNGEFILEDTILVSFGYDILYVFVDDFDDDSANEIVAVVEYFEIYYFEYENGEYVIDHQLEIDNGDIRAADVGDVDDDGIIEVVIGTGDGYVDVIGYEGNTYLFEWQFQVYNNEVTALGVGDSDDDEILEIVLGGYDSDLIFFDYIIYVVGYNGNGYEEEWSYTADSTIYAVDVGDSDNDGIKEFVVFIGNSDLTIFGWNGNTYLEEWTTIDFTQISDECIDICNIDSDGDNKFIVGEYELYVLSYETTYGYIWQTETFSELIQCIFVGDTDNYGANEIVVSIGSYIFIYGKDQRPFASLSASKTTVKIGEEVFFDGTNSTGIGILEYFFDFGDGQNTNWISESTYTHSYSTKGEYPVSLKVRDENGIESINPAEVKISVIETNKAPEAHIDKIDPNPAIEGETVSFSGYGFDEDGTIMSYWWKSNINGNLSTLDSFTTSSLSVGTHTIYFRVKDDKETWSESDTRTLVINPESKNQAPIAYIDSISPNPAIEGETVTFSGHGIDGDGTIISYTWVSDIDDVLDDKSSFSISSLSVGIHTISFMVKDNNEEWSEPETAILTVESEPQNQIPIAYIDSVTPNPAVEGEAVTFIGHGGDSDGTIISYSWESDIDGYLSSKRSFTTSSLSVGEHIITFKVKDDIDMWSESETVVLNVQEKEGEITSDGTGNNDLVMALFVGAIAILIIIAIATTIALARRKSRTGAIQISCPDCGSAFGVTSSFRPLTVQCPNCGLSGVLNE